MNLNLIKHEHIRFVNLKQHVSFNDTANRQAQNACHEMTRRLPEQHMISKVSFCYTHDGLSKPHKSPLNLTRSSLRGSLYDCFRYFALGVGCIVIDTTGNKDRVALIILGGYPSRQFDLGRCRKSGHCYES